MCLLIVRLSRVRLLRVGFDDRAELLAAAPDVYYVTDHYLNYSAVLVRLSRVTPPCSARLARYGSQVCDLAWGGTPFAVSETTQTRLTSQNLQTFTEVQRVPLIVFNHKLACSPSSFMNVLYKRHPVLLQR